MHQPAPSAPRSATCWSTQILICLAGILTGAGLVCLIAQRTPLGASSESKSKPDGVLIDFSSMHCGPCQQMRPIVEKLEQQGYPVRIVDVNQQSALAQEYGITSLPTFVLVVSGREVMRQQGATSEAQLRRMLLQIPEWQRELAGRDKSRTKETQFAEVIDETATTPSPFTVALGEPARELPPVEKPKSKFAIPLLGSLGGTRTAPKSASEARAADIVARSQTPDHDAQPSTPVAESMAASVRLRVKDRGGVNFGSGTVIDSRVGRTLVLTCGHLFRDLKSGAVVEVDVFDRSSKPETFVGQIVDVDLNADLGLVAIPTKTALTTAPLGTINRALAVGDKMLSIGCGGGDAPAREPLEITAINKYKGPDNLECTGVPVRGRSGGGLFRDRELMGVCFAADPNEKRGVYCGLKPIYELLEKAGFSHLLPVGRPETAPAIARSPKPAPKAQSESPPASAPAVPSVEPIEAVFAQARESTGVATTAPAAESLAEALQQSPDAEVICIVRPKNSSAPSRVVIVHQASPKLLSYLLDSMGPTVAGPGRKPDTLIQTSATTPPQPEPEFLARSATPPAESAPRRPQSPRPR
jgi:thiol-disulfide isomerase/thioredoxin